MARKSEIRSLVLQILPSPFRSRELQKHQQQAGFFISPGHRVAHAKLFIPLISNQLGRDHNFLLVSTPGQCVPLENHYWSQFRSLTSTRQHNWFFFIPVVLTLKVFSSVLLIVRFDCMLKFRRVSSMFAINALDSCVLCRDLWYNCEVGWYSPRSPQEDV